MDANITNALIFAIMGVVEAGLVGLLGLGFAWIKRNTKSESLKSALELLEQTATTTVGELQQTLVDGWKEANDDGKLTESEVRELKTKSLALVKKRLGAAAQEVVVAAGIDLNDRIRAAVEAAITAMKTANPILVGSATFEGVD